MGTRVQRRRARGFSLLETMVVLIVMVLLTSFAIVVYGNYRRALRTRSAARQIETLFATARALAINQNARFQVVLDLTTSGMWIDQIDRDGQVIAPKVTTPEHWSVYIKVLGVTLNGVTHQDGLVRVRFRPSGTSDAARLLLVSEGGGSRPSPPSQGGTDASVSVRPASEEHSARDYCTIKLYAPTARSKTFPGRL